MLTDQITKPEMSDARLDSGISPDEVRAELAKILSSRTFLTARGQSKFLAYVVTQFIAGRCDLIKECWIGREALERGDSFDPRLDPIVRTQARKLRIRLAKYYETEGADAPVRIEFHKGSYAPVLQRATSKPEETVTAQSAICLAPVSVPYDQVAPAQPPVPLPQHRSVEQSSWWMQNPAMLAVCLGLLVFAVAAATYSRFSD